MMRPILRCSLPDCDAECSASPEEIQLGMPQLCDSHLLEPLTPAQQRVQQLVDQRTAVRSKQVVAELSISHSWACKCLSSLVRAGVVNVRLAEGGEFEWSRRMTLNES
jgi:hypothetical protein